MKKLTKEDALKIRMRPNKRGSAAMGILMGMLPGEIILLEPKGLDAEDANPKYLLPATGAEDGEAMEVRDGGGWKRMGD